MNEMARSESPDISTTYSSLFLISKRKLLPLMVAEDMHEFSFLNVTN
jgi:hypothetical protein